MGVGPFSTMIRSVLILALIAGSVAAQQKPNNKKVFEPGKAAFSPTAHAKPFKVGEIPEDHLDAKSLTVPEGLEVRLWAKSPQLFNPTNMDVDAAGRLWVAEGVNYRRKAGFREAGDRIVVLEDTDHDGTADKSHTFVQDKELGAPLGVAVFDNVIVVSNTPNVIVYTDVNRNLKFDAAVDKREVLLTGFEQAQHDHSLHSISHSPDGRWIFSNGNCGALFTDKSEKTFRIGGAYLNNTWAGEASDDGHVYVGGFTCSINPDGTNARILGYGYRNSYEQVATSFGDMFQNDNDDPPACRVSHIIEGGDFGFFSADGKRSWQADKRPGQTVPMAEWRQDDPQTIPAGDVYGGGAPTGITYYENGALGEKWNGLLLSCETGRNVVFGYLPKPDGAGFKLERFDFITSNTTGKFAGSDFVGGSNNLSDERHILFRPSDVTVGTDGAVYVCDWFDKRTGGHQTLDDSASGAIYCIAPKGFVSKPLAIEFNTTEGCIAALKSPSLNVRHVAFAKLKAQGEKAVDAVAAVLADKNAYVSARAAWLLAQMGDAGVKKVEAKLTSDNDEERLVAFRALRAAGRNVLVMADKLATDQNAAVRREVSVSLRDVEAELSVPVLAKVASTYDGKDRSLLAAIGIGAAKKEAALWKALPANDSDAYARLTWRLHPKEAIGWLKTRALNAELSVPQRKLAVDTLAFIDDAQAADALLTVAKDRTSPINGDVVWWLIHRSTNDWSKYDVTGKLKSEGILDPEKIVLTAVVSAPAMPADVGPQVAEVIKLKGDATRGATAVQRCYMCHNINGQGIDFGPGLTGWGATQPTDVIAEAMINPNKDIAHGYEGHTLMTKDGLQIDGILLNDGNFSMIKSVGGQTQIVPKEKLKSKQKMTRSLMMSAAMLGMTAQDIGDVIAYLKQPVK